MTTTFSRIGPIVRGEVMNGLSILNDEFLPEAVASVVREFAEVMATRVNIGDGRDAGGQAGFRPIVAAIAGETSDTTLRDQIDAFSSCLSGASQPSILLFPTDHVPTQAGGLLSDAGLHIHFEGVVPRDSRAQHAMAVLWPTPTPELWSVSPSFRVTAIMTVFNEADILAASIDHLSRQGVEAYVIDNWSTDHSFEIARELMGNGVIEVERYPPSGPTGSYDWEDLLTRVEEVAEVLPSDWIVHHDVDEYRTSPWPGVSMRTALHFVCSIGFNSVDHTVLIHHPTDDLFAEGEDFVEAFPYFEFGTKPGHFKQIKAWTNPRKRVDLASTGGHQAIFGGRRLFPFNFILRHYPIRNQDQGERKVFSDRKARWNEKERSRGWHSHYDSIAEGHCFIRDRESLIRYDESTFHREYLMQRLLRVGLGR